ncbi:MAG: DUF2007 domain-containing protein [bacterium]|nr:DUF2007 domain-containing protein [bacterium]
MIGWVHVYKTSSAIDAEIVKDMLIDMGIDAVVVNQIDRSYTFFGEAKVFCREADEAQARLFINQNAVQENE